MTFYTVYNDIVDKFTMTRRINIIIIRIWQNTSTQVKYVININN
jgi:hypothetical protein